MLHEDNRLTGVYDRSRAKKIEHRYNEGELPEHRRNLPGSDSKSNRAYTCMSLLGYSVFIEEIENGTSILFDKDGKRVAKILETPNSRKEHVPQEYVKDVRTIMRLYKLQQQQAEA